MLCMQRLYAVLACKFNIAIYCQSSEEADARPSVEAAVLSDIYIYIYL